VKVQLLGTDYLSLAEVKVWGTVSAPSGSYGALQRLNVSAGGRLLAVDEVQTDGSKVTSYLMADRQGSTRVLMNAAGAVTSRHDYLPFGEELGAGTGAPGSPTGMRTAAQGYSAADNVRQRYADTRLDEATGLDHTLWRKLETRSGRWTTPDPYGSSLIVGDPQSFNRYAHVNNDPINFVDPSGLNKAKPFIGNFSVDVYVSWLERLMESSWAEFGGGFGGLYDFPGPESTDDPGGPPIRPQKPVGLSRSEISSLMDDILKLFRDHSDCKGSMNTLLAELKRSTGYGAGSITDIIEAFRNNGIASQGSGTDGGGSAGTGIGGVPSISFNPGSTPEQTAMTVMGEMMHWAGMPMQGGQYANYYTDAAMASAWHNLGVVMSVEEYRRTYPDQVEADTKKWGYDFAESRLAHGGMDAACLGTVNGYLPKYAKP
jgi:RHS repeat-associated protein